MPYDARLINVDTGKINALDAYLEAKAESLLAGGFYGTPEEPQSASPFLTQYLPKPQEQFTQSEIAKSAFERENEVGSFIAKAQNGFNYNNEVDPQDPDFDIIDYINDEVDNSDYAPYAENFLQFKNRRNADLYKKHLDREFRNTEVLQNSGWSGVAWGIGASLLSPVNLIPIGGGAYKAYKAGQLAKGVALTAGAGAVSMTGSEILLQGSQESRTLGESVMNIGAGTLLAGALGGASATLSKKQFSQLAKKVEKDIQSDVAEVKINPQTQNVEIRPDSASAASKAEYDPIRKQYDEIYTPEIIAKGETPLPFKDYLKQQTALVPTITQDVAKLLKVDKLTKKINLINNLNPILRLTQTEYAVKPREFAQKLMKTGLYTNKNLEGIANYQSAEINKKATLANYVHNYRPAEDIAYREFKQRIKKEGAKPADTAIKNDIQFYEALSRAGRNGDVSPIPEINKLAQTARQQINKLSQEAVNVGILDENILKTAPKTAISYFPRLWNKMKVNARENELRQLLFNKIKNVLLPQIKEAELNKERILNTRILDLQTKKADLENKLEKASEAKIKEAVNNATINEPNIPNEYKQIFLDNINYSKINNTNLDKFAEALSEQLPDSFPFTYDDIEKVYNKYVKGEESIFSTDEALNLLNRYIEAERTISKTKIKSLFQHIRELGGIVDYGGDLKSMGITNKTMPGLIRKAPSNQNDFFGESSIISSQKTGADDIILKLMERGYFIEREDGSMGKPTIRDLYELIKREAHGEKMYSSSDIEKVRIKESAEYLLNELEQLGIDFDKLKEAVKLKKGKIKKYIEIKTENTSKVIDTKTYIKIDKLLAKTEIELMDKKINTLKNQYTEKQIEIRSKFEEIGDENDYINEIVSDIVAKLKGEDRLGLVNDTDIKIDKRGPLKERTLNFVMDNELEPWLENDARKVMAYYANTLATDIEIARAFDGDLTLSNAVEEISREYDDAISKTTTEDEAIKINKEKRTAINDLTSVAKIMRGIYARPDNPDSMIVRGGRIARQYNYITKMGQVVMSSISDISRPISKHGLATWAKTLPNLITNLKGIKLNIKDAKLAGNISDTVMPERMASFSSLNDTFASNNSTFERYVENISALMSKINMMPVWNDGMKGFSSVMTQQRMIDNILNYEKADKRNITYLAQIGIGKDRINDIVKEIKKHSYKEGNLWVANTEKWENKEIARIYYNALNTDVDSTIATMGAGDLPLWGNTEVGKIILQFKSFAFASTQQTLLAGLQQKDLAVLNGVISATSLGMLSYYLKRKMAGKEPSDNPAVWLSEGLDRSGYLAILSEYSHIADKAGLGVSSLTGIEQSSRYASRNAAASLLGPSIALVDDGFTTARALSSGEISPSDARAIRRMIFLNNHWLLTGAMDRLQESLVNTE